MKIYVFVAVIFLFLLTSYFTGFLDNSMLYLTNSPDYSYDTIKKSAFMYNAFLFGYVALFCSGNFFAQIAKHARQVKGSLSKAVFYFVLACLSINASVILAVEVI